MDPPAASKRRDRRRRRRRRSAGAGAGAAAALEPGADVLAERQGEGGPEPGIASAAATRRRRNRRRRRKLERSHAEAAEANPEAPVSVEAILNVSLPETATASKKIVNPNDTKVSAEDGTVSAALARGNCNGEIEDLGSKFVEQSEELQGYNENGASVNSSNLKEEKKETREKRGRKKRNLCKKTTSQGSPLPTVITIGESVSLDITAEKRCGSGRSNLDSITTRRNELQEQDIACLSNDQNVDCSCPSSMAEAYMEKPSSMAEAYVEKLEVVFSQRRSLSGFPKKKLLILDLNGLLADINQDSHNAHLANARVRGKLVFQRPYCDDFLNFCAQNFELGIWSSRKKENVESVIDIVMRDFKQRLLFCWDMSKCTFTGHKTLENMHKPLMLKELRKLWNKEEPDLPWEEGAYSPSNTLLVDDSPYKALRNPPHTAIFPHTYSYLNRDDNSLSPGGDLRLYLQNLATADDVESYVYNNPFGQPFITESDPHWNFYAQIADKGNTL